MFYFNSHTLERESLSKRVPHAYNELHLPCARRGRAAMGMRTHDCDVPPARFLHCEVIRALPVNRGTEASLSRVSIRRSIDPRDWLFYCSKGKRRTDTPVLYALQVYRVYKYCYYFCPPLFLARGLRTGLHYTG